MSGRRGRAHAPELRAKALALLEAGRSVSSVAEELEVGRSTLSRWVRATRAEVAIPDETGHSTGLSPKQEAALTSLLAGGSVTEAATAAKVERQTASKWLNHDAEFQAVLAGRQEERRRAHERLIGGLVGEAAETLREVMGDASAPHSARVAAARAVLGLAMPNPIQVKAEVMAEVACAEPDLEDLLTELWSDPAMREISERLAADEV